jgi:hypothetical protein
MDQFTAASNTLLSSALAVFGAFVNFLIQILNFFLVLLHTILTVFHLQ